MKCDRDRYDWSLMNYAYSVIANELGLQCYGTEIEQPCRGCPVIDGCYAKGREPAYDRLP